jgi:aminoglycoside N3'-acetyltransferase
MDSPATGNRLIAELRGLGAEAGDTLMVHASLRAVGPVEGGAAGLVAALERAVAPDGTVLMVLGARDDWAWVNDKPEHERAALLADAEPFDAHRTPADPDVGALAEVFRTLPGTVVGDHPEGRFGARGRRANELVWPVPWDDYYGPGSPLERLVDSRAKVLRLGADYATTTLLHYAEYLVDIPGKRRVRRHRLVATPTGSEVRTIESLDDSDGIVEYPGDDYFADVLRSYLGTGRGAVGRVGGAPSELVDAADLVAFSVRWMEQHLPR